MPSNASTHTRRPSHKTHSSMSTNSCSIVHTTDSHTHATGTNTFIPNNSLFPTTVVVGQIVAVFRDILEIEIGIVIEKRAKDIGRYGSGVFHCNSHVSTICFNLFQNLFCSPNT